MRKLKYILSAFIVMLTVSSCVKLDQYPEDKLTDKNYWVSVAKAEVALNRAYSQMYGAGRMWSDEYLSDNMYSWRGLPGERYIRTGIATPATGIFKDVWRGSFEGIKTCNIFLANIDNVPFKETADSDAVMRMTDEIRFIRAYIYLALTGYYGDVPLLEKDLFDINEAKNATKTSHADIVKFVHAELDEVIKNKNLPIRDNLPQAERGRLTMGAVSILKARAYLYEGDFKNAEKYCYNLIGNQAEYGTYELFNDGTDKAYSNLFTPENEYNSEIILDRQYLPKLVTWDDMFDLVPISMGGRVNQAAPTQSLVDNYMTINGLSIKNDPTYNETDPYKNRDPRLHATVVYNGYKWEMPDGTTKTIMTKPGSGTDGAGSGNTTPSGYYVHKYWDHTMDATMQNGINIIMMRYADVLLMWAEARNEQAKLTQAEWDMTVKAIRERAGFTDAAALNYPSTDQNGMREIIRSERRSELALEGLRWYDIKRWKIGDKVLSGPVYGAKFANNGTGYIRLDTYIFNAGRDYLWSLPLSEMDQIPGLRPNNPGY